MFSTQNHCLCNISRLIGWHRYLSRLYWFETIVGERISRCRWPNGGNVILIQIYIRTYAKFLPFALTGVANSNELAGECQVCGKFTWITCRILSIWNHGIVWRYVAKYLSTCENICHYKMLFKIYFSSVRFTYGNLYNGESIYT